MPVRACLAALLLLCALPAPCTARQLLVVTYGDEGQTSLSWEDGGLPASEKGSPDLPMDEPPLARTVTGFQPEGVHLTLWTADSVLVSWQTGAPIMGSDEDVLAPYDPAAVKAAVRWGTASGEYSGRAEGRPDDSVVYTYSYWANLTASTNAEVYHSPILHHVLLPDLQPGATYFYSVGNDQDGWSPEFNFTVPRPSWPLRLGMAGDVGQTANSSATLAKLAASDPDIVLILGDFSYADDHTSGNSSGAPHLGNMYISNPPRWDTWARLSEPLLAHWPLISCRGNHEIEILLTADNATMTAADARYPYPQDRAAPRLATGPNVGAWFMEQIGTTFDNDTGRSQYFNETGFAPQSGYYSLDLPGQAHIVSLNSYLPWGPDSRQRAWLLEDLAKVNREKTPWLIVIYHAAAYHSYSGHFKEADTFLSVFEDIFYEHGVDLVYQGHVHSYERSYPVYKYQRNDCAPMYTLLGDGGNVEGLYTAFIDTQPQNAYCSNVSLYRLPSYQFIPYAEPVITLQDGQVCPSSQPAWSAYREPTFGHGVLELHNATHATWEWRRTIDVGPAEGAVDRVQITRPPPGTCRARSAPGAASSSTAPRLPLALLLQGVLAAATAWL